MKSKDVGVSPVVGVMLMLAVTIMIAAIVSATAGNFSNTEKKAPSAILDVSIFAHKQYDGYSSPTMIIRHISGNVLQTKDLQIITYYTIPGSSNISRGSLIGETAVKGHSDWGDFSGSEWCGTLFINDKNRFDDGSTVQSTNGGNENWFGNASATFKPGDMLVTAAQYAGNTDDTDENNIHCNPSMKQLFPNVLFIEGDSLGGSCSISKGVATDQFVQGGVVSVKIIHTPSGQIIYDKDVVIS
jgi:FlaG/FlaF family flagellin (archaellin)